ncbi:FAD-dependent oxidoreductase [Longispora sp. NPDC051575]|uniref:FAD-binding oxidoreductase n=1 Tax=Longispora sp. NPDC051575 TaxID=3154943 RepID=UPI0034448DEB
MSTDISRATLVLPLPSELPQTTTTVVAHLEKILRRMPRDHAVALDTGADAGAARADLLAWCGPHLDRGAAAEPTTAPNSDVHDRYFAVRRATGDSAALLAGALLASDLLVQDDLVRHGSTLDADPESMLLGVTSYLTDGKQPPVLDVPWAPADPVAAAHHRWQVGHQRFFVMLQLLAVAVRQVRRATDVAGENEAVRLFAWLCRSSAHAMRYAADFPAELYDEIRVTMVPPTVNVGFSGLQTRDHNELVAQFRTLKRSGTVDRLAPESATALHAAVREMYDAHIWVCDRFGGGSGLSLLMEHTSAGKQESGVASAVKLARQRLTHLRQEPGTPPTARPDAGRFRQRIIADVLRPDTPERVAELIRSANGRRFHPVSTGYNWGLGSRQPVEDGVTVLDLAGLNRIRAVDTRRGYAVIEPGVIQGALARRLDGTDRMLNLTGASQHTSVIGNILDRGVGLHRPRVDDLAGLELVLADGSQVRTGWWPDAGQPAAVWPHGRGPALNQLFTQSDLAVVTAATIRLLPRPEAIRILPFTFRAEALGEAVDLLRTWTAQGLVPPNTKIFNPVAARAHGIADQHLVHVCLTGTRDLVSTLSHLVTRAAYGTPLSPAPASTWCTTPTPGCRTPPTPSSSTRPATRPGRWTPRGDC